MSLISPIGPISLSAFLSSSFQVRELVRTAIVVVVQPMCKSFLVVPKCQGRGIPVNWTLQLTGYIEQAAERVGAASVLNRSNRVFMLADGVDEVLHVG